MNRFWAILFFMVPVLAVGTFILAALDVGPMKGLWLPKNINTHGESIDSLWNLTHIIGAVILIGTGFALAIGVWSFGARSHDRFRYFSHNNRLEVLWSIIPAIVLVSLAFAQMPAWFENKQSHPMVTVNGQEVFKSPLARVVARRFGWEVYYPGPDGVLETADDLYFENELHVPFGEEVVLQLESRDVIHSFFIPSLRVKQDIVPGHVHNIWFHATEAQETSLVCAELCGWGHYTMHARVSIKERAAFDSWMSDQLTGDAN
ncbi:MAG: cytochrome c oxidase subunit II [Pirellulaceae bacterium]